jgi:hypothetical protein
MIDVGIWEAIGYLVAAFIIGGIVGMTALAVLVGGRE